MTDDELDGSVEQPGDRDAGTVEQSGQSKESAAGYAIPQDSKSPGSSTSKPVSGAPSSPKSTQLYRYVVLN